MTDGTQVYALCLALGKTAFAVWGLPAHVSTVWEATGGEERCVVVPRPVERQWATARNVEENLTIDVYGVFRLPAGMNDLQFGAEKADLFTAAVQGPRYPRPPDTSIIGMPLVSEIDLQPIGDRGGDYLVHLVIQGRAEGNGF